MRHTQVMQVTALMLLAVSLVVNAVAFHRFSVYLKRLRRSLEAQAEEQAEAMRYIMLVAAKLGYRPRDVEGEARRKAERN